MRSDFILITRIFIHVRGYQYGEALFVRRQRNRAAHLRTSPFGSIYNFLSRLIDQPMIKGFQPDSDTLILHLVCSPNTFLNDSVTFLPAKTCFEPRKKGSGILRLKLTSVNQKLLFNAL
jgi:hypothetical protein